ncbi:Ferredoxin [Pseudonocardia sp. Ae406_Ps2]|nr:MULTISPECIES: ferredoxin [unclassified Pseudonocardia]ALE84614.1 ferredoxin [Pseudonocardia sp. HH130629-09]KAA1031057.1 ferredoxin [Pseudonocardia sp. EV170527-09]OLL96525.1 Ferredoxin [Pseudonocardia sp. Ae331_Ps2]OLM05768.1 Ferredoxin [Pseudonocardia sp. Ae406_Ps2]OLM27343.1 Ferredoxin [Pseudonocardia sp. Ae706_Ps2]
MKVEVDQHACVGSGQCLLTAPDVFDQRDSDAVVELLTDTPPDGQEQAVRNAAHGCPAAAITVVEG